MAKLKEYSKTFGIFCGNFRGWCRKMKANVKLSAYPEIKFPDCFLKNFAQSIDDATAMQLFACDIRHELIQIYLSLKIVNF